MEKMSIHHRCRRWLKYFSYSTSPLKRLHSFVSDFVWMILGLTPTKFVKFGVLPQFSIELQVNLCNFSLILNISFSLTRPLTRNHSYIIMIMVHQLFEKFQITHLLQIGVWQPQCHLALLFTYNVCYF